MLKLNNRERKMIIVGGASLALVVVYVFLLGPFLKSKNELDDELEYSYRLYQEYRSILADETVYQEELQARRGEMLGVSRLLLSGNTSSLAAAELSNKVRAFADETGVSITRETVIKTEVSDQHQRISIQLNMSCDIIGIQEFLEKIENDSNLLFISSLEIKSPASMRRSFSKGNTRRRRSSGSEKLRVTMIISGYIEGEEISSGGER